MDPSQASVNANQPEQTETITCMDFDSYDAAAEFELIRSYMIWAKNPIYILKHILVDQIHRGFLAQII